MPSSDPSDSTDPDGSDDPEFVYCRTCGAKVPSGWRFCRSCESSLDDALPPDRKGELVSGLYGDRSDADPGCPKCDRTDPEIRIVETTGTDVTPRIPSQSERFRVVSCGHCGYAEFYTRGDDEILVDLFLER